MKNKQKKQHKDPYGFARRSWGSVNPVTRVHENKRRYRRKKRIDRSEME